MSPKNSQVMALDIDRTIINTDLLTDLILKKIQEILDLEKENTFSAIDLLKQHKDEVYPKGIRSIAKFKPEKLFEFIAKKTNIEAKKIEQAFYDSKIWEPRKIIFQDAQDFFNKTQKNRPKLILGIFSEGVVEWQKEKLELLNLNKYLTTENQYRLIFPNKLSKEAHEKLENLPEGSIIVDDRLDILLTLEEIYKDRLILIHINRNDNEESKKIITINKLTDKKLMNLLETKN